MCPTDLNTVSLLVSLGLEPSQPQRITSGLKTNFHLSPNQARIISGLKTNFNLFPNQARIISELKTNFSLSPNQAIYLLTKLHTSY